MNLGKCRMGTLHYAHPTQIQVVDKVKRLHEAGSLGFYAEKKHGAAVLTTEV